MGEGANSGCGQAAELEERAVIASQDVLEEVELAEIGVLVAHRVASQVVESAPGIENRRAGTLST